MDVNVDSLMSLKNKNKETTLLLYRNRFLKMFATKAILGFKILENKSSLRLSLKEL